MRPLLRRHAVNPHALAVVLAMHKPTETELCDDLYRGEIGGLDNRDQRGQPQLFKAVGHCAARCFSAQTSPPEPAREPVSNLDLVPVFDPLSIQTAEADKG